MAARQEVQLKQQTNLAVVDEDMNDAGIGISTAPEDNKVPLMYILQSLSRAVSKTRPEYVEGAKPGLFLLKSANPPLAEEILFQPVAFYKEFVEWRPRAAGGGIVDRHKRMPLDAKKVMVGKKTTFVRENGNDVVETIYRPGLAHTVDGRRLPCVSFLSSTGLSVSQEWMSLQNSFKFSDGVTSRPAFSQLYRLQLREATNDAGSWFKLVPKHERSFDKTDQDYAIGKALADAFAAGEKRAADEERDSDGEF